MKKLGRAINIFGSKVNNAHRYPKPRYRQIIEPFAGGAGYSLLHNEHDVILCDIRPEVVEAWEYLIGASPAEVLALPLIREGEHIDELKCSAGGRRLISWCLNQTAGPRVKISSWGVYHALERGAASYWCESRKMQAARICAKVSHWSVVLGTYADFDPEEWPASTWFVDPPYADIPRMYGTPELDYSALADWCRRLQGQAIVCERAGADWLPFEPLYSAPTARRYLEGAAKVCREAVWTT